MSTGTGSRRGTRGTRPGSGRSSRGRLGAGLVEVPPVPSRDPAAAVLADPQVPENRRFCGNCGQPVGQSRDGRPGLAEGFCRQCGTRFSFSPKLEPGELVAGQYEVIGCLAHGGLGWIYLAKDRNVSDRWVVLKGLLNTGDADALAAAVAERQFLAQVEHPNIVRIYNFVQHASRRDGETAGYIVMEYVGGKSLKQIRLEARQHGGVVPLAHALAYAIEILPALGYLHDRGLVYCDFKPDNVIQTEEQLKLIDMGGVRPIDGDGPIYGTVGYQAPEIESEGPSPSSDLYTIGRTLAVLTLEFTGYQGEYRYRLPAAMPLLVQQESFARLLRRATHADPKRRFQSAGEMAEQITGVLQGGAVGSPTASPGRRSPACSAPSCAPTGTDLTPVRAANGGRATRVSPPTVAEVIAGLPAPLADGTDPAAGYLATLGGLQPEQQAATLRRRRRGRARASRRRWPRRRRPGWRWSAPSSRRETRTAPRPTWPSWPRPIRPTGGSPGTPGCATSRAPGPDSAPAAFSAVYDELPGELAPKLALGFAAEAVGDMAAARHYYQLVWTIDRSCISAAFGAARACLAVGDRPAAIAAVAAVPETSSHHAAAQIAAVRLLLAAGNGVTAGDLRQADGRLGVLSLDDMRRQQLTIEVLHAALDWVAGQPPDAAQGAARSADGRILGCEPNERALRFGLERGYRALASLTPDPARKVELVDMANAVRPRTWT